MKKSIWAVSAAILVGMAATVKADFYAGAGFGMSFNNGSIDEARGFRDSYKDTPAYALYGGYELPLPLLDIRGEVEYLRIKPKAKHGNSRTMDAAMARAVAVVPFVPLVDPYVGLGLGYARYDHANIALQEMTAGVEYELPVAPITIGAEYRYLKSNEKAGKWYSESKFHTNILMLKAKYLF